MASATSYGVHQETSATGRPRAIGQPNANNDTATHHYHRGDGLNNGGTNKPGTKLDIGIVGAGLAGLGMAIALRRKGYAVEVGAHCRFPSESHEYLVYAEIHFVHRR